MQQIKAESSIQDKKKRGLPCSRFGVDLKIIQGFAKTFLDMAYTIQFINSITVDSSLKMFLFLFFVLIRSFPRYVLFGGYFQTTLQFMSFPCFVFGDVASPHKQHLAQIELLSPYLLVESSSDTTWPKKCRKAYSNIHITKYKTWKRHKLRSCFWCF